MFLREHISGDIRTPTMGSSYERASEMILEFITISFWSDIFSSYINYCECA